MERNGGHVIISGTGRAGTTLLVQYFTFLDLDTGFKKENVLSSVDSISKAGLEHDLRTENLPKIIKSPWFADQILEVLSNGRVKIDYAIIPVRDIVSAAESRRRVFHEARALGFDPLLHPGTLWKTENPDEQEAQLALQFHKLIYGLATFHIPTYFVVFPNFAKSHDVLYTSIRPILEALGVSKERSERAYAAVVDRGLIHYI